MAGAERRALQGQCRDILGGYLLMRSDSLKAMRHCRFCHDGALFAAARFCDVPDHPSSPYSTKDAEGCKD